MKPVVCWIHRCRVVNNKRLDDEGVLLLRRRGLDDWRLAGSSGELGEAVGATGSSLRKVSIQACPHDSFQFKIPLVRVHHVTLQIPLPEQILSIVAALNGSVHLSLVLHQIQCPSMGRPIQEIHHSAVRIPADRAILATHVPFAGDLHSQAGRAVRAMGDFSEQSIDLLLSSTASCERTTSLVEMPMRATGISPASRPTRCRRLEIRLCSQVGLKFLTDPAHIVLQLDTQRGAHWRDRRPRESAIHRARQHDLHSIPIVWRAHCTKDNVQ
mmetsp:Transcript_30553/g.79121  ORF Transcript_30553/g.79121 Transcript_30553/m.79121 type:complete len:270 (+) Transcript_30553:5328-6137(+)